MIGGFGMAWSRSSAPRRRSCAEFGAGSFGLRASSRRREYPVKGQNPKEFGLGCFTVPAATTFLKRQKEMKRQEKQRAKAERRLQKKLAKQAGNDVLAGMDFSENDSAAEGLSGISESDPQN